MWAEGTAVPTLKQMFYTEMEVDKNEEVMLDNITCNVGEIYRLRQPATRIRNYIYLSLCLSISYTPVNIAITF